MRISATIMIRFRIRIRLRIRSVVLQEIKKTDSIGLQCQLECYCEQEKPSQTGPSPSFCFFWAQTKMSWHSLLTAQYSR